MSLMKKFFLKLSKFEKFILLFTLIFLIFSRFYKLGQIPVSLTHDETVYAIQAKSFAVQGINTSQEIRPWSMSLLHHMYAEWPATIMIPGFFFSDNPILATHLMTAILSLLIPISIAFIFHALWNDTTLTISALLVATLNPLFWQFGRLSYDAIFSVAFYLIGAAFYLNLKGKGKLLSLVFYIFGFFQYQGMKLLFFPWIFLFFVLEFLKDKKFKNLKELWTNILKIIKTSGFFILLFSFFFTFFYVFVILAKQDVGGRLSSTILTDNAFLSPLVDTQRRLSLASPLGRIFSNKLTLSLEFIINNLFAAFSPVLLFIQGETSSSAFAVWTHGLFYLFDAVLFLVALIYLFSNKKYFWQSLVLVLVMVFFSLPALINTMSQWFLLRTMLSYVLFSFFIIFGFFVLFKNKILKWGLLGIYSVSVIYFSYQFFYRYPVYSADAAEFQERIMARYIGLVKEQNPNQEVIVYTNEPERYFADYLLYRNLLNDENKDQIALAYQLEDYSLNQLHFTNDCIDFSSNAVIIGDILHSRCKLNEDVSIGETEDFNDFIEEQEDQALSIAAILDSGEMMRIYNDQICKTYEMKPYLRINKLADFSVEELSEEDFCQTWITDLRVMRD